MSCVEITRRKKTKTSGLNINSAVHTAFNHGENTTRPTSKYHRTLTITLDREAYENAKATGIYICSTLYILIPMYLILYFWKKNQQNYQGTVYNRNPKIVKCCSSWIFYASPEKKRTK